MAAAVVDILSLEVNAIHDSVITELEVILCVSSLSQIFLVLHTLLGV